MSASARESGAVTWWEWTALLGLFVLALFLRIGVIEQYEAANPLADRPVIDEASYETWAQGIARGDWMGEEVFFQEPLYPYWMGAVFAIFGESRTAVRLAQAGLGAITVLLVWALARRLFGRAPALLAALAMATYRPALLFPSLLLKPNLFLPLLAGLALALEAARSKGADASPTRSFARWLAVGLLAGAGALLRGNVLVLLPVFVLWPPVEAALRRRLTGRAAASALAVALGAAAVLAPVAWRNHHVGGVWVLTTSGAGTNVYGGNNAANPYGIATEFDWVRGIPEFEAEDWRHEAERRLGRELAPDEVSSYWLGEVGRSLREHPWLHLRILWNKLRLTLGAYEVPDNHHLEWDARTVPLLGLPLPGFGLWGWLALAGMFLLPTRRRGAANGARRGERLALAALVLAYLGTIVLTVTSMRIRIALVPLMLPFAGGFLLRAWRSPRTGELVRVLAVAALAALVVHVPVLDAAQREENLAARDFNALTYELREDGASEGLLERVTRLDERYPGTLRVWSLRAEVEFGLARDLAERGETERAKALVLAARDRLETVIERSGTNERERHRARVLAGDLASFAGVPAAARHHYRLALEFDPTDAHVRRGLAEAMLVLGASDGPEAEDLLEGAIDQFTRSLELDGERPDERRIGLANAQFLLAERREGEERRTLLDAAEANLATVREGPRAAEVAELLDRVRAAR